MISDAGFFLSAIRILQLLPHTDPGFVKEKHNDFHWASEVAQWPMIT